MRASASVLAASLVTALPARAEAPPAPLPGPGERAEATPPPPPAAGDEATSDHGSALGDDARMRDLPRLERVRRVTLGVDLGMQALPARAGTADYSPGLAWAASARTELARWMGLRFIARHATHGVSLSGPRMVGADGVAVPGDTELRQPALDAWLLAARLEPTWVMTPRLRLWLGLGAGWLRVEAPAVGGTLGGGCAPGEVAGTPLTCEIVSAARSAVATELGATLGASIDLLPNWLALNLSTGLGAVVDQSGTMFDSVQAVSAGSLYEVGGYPRFGGSATVLLGLGLIL